MSKAPTSNTRRQSVDRHGKDVTLTNYSGNDEGDYPDSRDSGTDHTITARAWTRTRASTDRDAESVGEEDTDRLFLIKDDDSGVSNITEGGGRLASEITEGSQTYYIINSRKNGDGTLTLETRKD